jgi:protein gp37
MGENSNIEWCHHTFNPWRGCTKVSEGCKFCYADTLSARNPKTLGVWGPKGTRPVAAETYWRLPERWNKEAAAAGERRRVFCASLADVFEGPETMPQEAYHAITVARIRLRELIKETQHLDWLLLSKRPQNASLMFSREVPDNVWIGTSVENQEQADKRIPQLLEIAARVRFLSCEPLLGPVDLHLIKGQPIANAPCAVAHSEAIHWVIGGGESGPNARPMHPDWARSLRDQCRDANVPYFHKQNGEWSFAAAGNLSVDTFAMWPDGHISQSFSDNNGNPPKGCCLMWRSGKKRAGRLLDGRTWDEFPEVAR